MKKYILFFLIAFSTLAQSQTVYLPVNHSVYDFLKKMEAQQIITDYRDAVLPLTRENIAKFLIAVDSSYEKLSAVDFQRLEFYKEEFFVELEKLEYQGFMEERWHLYSYRSSPAILNVDLVGGYSYQKHPTDKNTKVRSNGAMAYGYIGNITGAYFYFRDNQEKGTLLDIRKDLSPVPGQVISRAQENYIEYDVIDAQVTFDISFLKLSFEKMHNVWGAGNKGNLIFSTKAPSYPQIKLRAEISKDITFTYFHAWLHSGITDSVLSYYVDNVGVYRKIYKAKYVAAHMLEITPWNGVDIALGESEVYGGRNPELLYLIPIMLFKGAEHYALDTDNSQFFMSVDFNFIKNVNTYGTIFIDEFSTEEFFMKDRQRNQLGYTVGTKIFDIYYPNTEFLVEYTRINPWAYNHKFPDATYQTHFYDLGHWIGQNADYLFLGANYRPMWNLQVGLQFESLRKGDKLPTIRQYQLPTPEFLYKIVDGKDVPGPSLKKQSFGITAHYEPVRDLFVDFHLFQSRYTNVIGNGVNDYAKKIDFFVGFKYNF